jgi:LysM repeat protein
MLTITRWGENSEYNNPVITRLLLHGWIALAIVIGIYSPAGGWIIPQVQPGSAPAADVSAYELILAMNTLRTSNGLPALIEDAIINAVAQATAETMAANEMSWHIGNVSGRLQAAGYGGGAKVWATENFATGNHSIDEIMVVWSDASHMIPAVNPAYCHVGAGVAKSPNGRNYYVLQAAYTSTKSCGEYRPPAGLTPQVGGDPNQNGGSGIVSQMIIPVKIATPDGDGRIFHEVQPGQSFWAIAVAYKITIADLESWNNISREAGLKIGQKLFIPGSNTEGYSTPTPVGMVLIDEPGADGKIVHVVQPYQALFSIAQAYKVSVDTILALNGIQQDWPLQIGQELIISSGNATTIPPSPPLSPVELLTPASDGRYYHAVKSGETLSWIAGLYEISLAELMAWNGLNGESILIPDQRLVLLVTPPPTATPTSSPTASLTPTLNPTTDESSEVEIKGTSMPGSVEDGSPSGSGGNGLLWLLTIGMATGGLALLAYSIRRRR